MAWYYNTEMTKLYGKICLIANNWSTDEPTIISYNPNTGESQSLDTNTYGIADGICIEVANATQTGFRLLYLTHYSWVGNDYKLFLIDGINQNGVPVVTSSIQYDLVSLGQQILGLPGRDYNYNFIWMKYIPRHKTLLVVLYYDYYSGVEYAYLFQFALTPSGLQFVDYYLVHVETEYGLWIYGLPMCYVEKWDLAYLATGTWGLYPYIFILKLDGEGAEATLNITTVQLEFEPAEGDYMGTEVPHFAYDPTADVLRVVWPRNQYWADESYVPLYRTLFFTAGFRQYTKLDQSAYRVTFPDYYMCIGELVELDSATAAVVYAYIIREGWYYRLKGFGKCTIRKSDGAVLSRVEGASNFPLYSWSRASVLISFVDMFGNAYIVKRSDSDYGYTDLYKISWNPPSISLIATYYTSYWGTYRFYYDAKSGKLIHYIEVGEA